MGAGINTVVPSFLIVPAFRSIQLFGRFSCPVVPAVRTIHCVLPIVKGLNGNGNKLTEISFVKENNKFKMKITLDRHGPRLITNNCHLPYPFYFSLLSTFYLFTRMSSAFGFVPCTLVGCYSTRHAYS